MRNTSFLSALTAVMLLVPFTSEASAFMRDYVPASQRSRPSNRFIEAAANVRWNQQASVRRSFVRKLERLEKRRDEIIPEDAAAEAPDYDVNPQDFTPYHWIIRRRHVRHQYWDSHFQRGTQAHTGQGLLGQPSLVEDENYRNDIEVDAGGR